MSNNNRRGGRQTRNSNRQIQGGSRPTSPDQTKFTFGAPEGNSNKDQPQSIWETYRKKNPLQTTEQQLKKALEAEKAMELEQNIIKDSFGPSPTVSQPKGKEKENS